MGKNALRQIRLVRDEDVEILPQGKPIGITATATTERRNGQSVIRLRLETGTIIQESCSVGFRRGTNSCMNLLSSLAGNRS